MKIWVYFRVRCLRCGAQVSLMFSWLHPALPWSLIPVTFVPGVSFIWQVLYVHYTQLQKELRMCVKQVMCQGVCGAELVHFCETIKKR